MELAELFPEISPVQIEKVTCTDLLIYPVVHKRARRYVAARACVALHVLLWLAESFMAM